MSDACRSCKAPIKWVKTASGEAMPVDAEPRADGNLRLRFNLGFRDAVAAVAAEDRLEGELLYVSHFATCPEAGEWRS